MEARNFYPSAVRHVTPTASGSDVVSYTSDLGPSSPILTLIHGYPQSAYIWRKIVPALVGKVSLFIPELPGYGISTPASKNTRKDIVSALLEALRSNFKISNGQKRQVILGGHDRGARICHRMAVIKDEFSWMEVIGAILIDIVPTKVQWDNFANPAIAQGYFHWPFLANVDLAVEMIKAYGGGNWCRAQHLRITKSHEGIARLESDGALDVYADLFEKEETIRGSCNDYASGATPEYEEQAQDQEAGRKIKVPTMVMFSEAGIGLRMDVAAIWADWISPGVRYEPKPIGKGYGHYLPEEAYDIVTVNILSFLHTITMSD